jgi:hypothetical protein
MNLITERWLPGRTRDGSSCKFAPHEITNPDILYLDFPRADINVAMPQFLLGLIQVTAAPANNDEWLKGFEHPPKLDFSALAYAFNLFDPKMPFMQNPGVQKETSIFSLFFDGPGEITLKNNKDFFRKRQEISAICPTCAAAALFSRQVSTSVGGIGYSGGIRGGGSLSLMAEGDTLWETLWLNVIPKDQTPYGNPKGVLFPWVTKQVLPKQADCHPWQIYWETPWSVRLATTDEEGDCGCCGEHTKKLVTGICKDSKQFPSLQYREWDHPLAAHTDEGKLLRTVWSDERSIQKILFGTDGRRPSLPVARLQNMGYPIKGIHVFAILQNQAKFINLVDVHAPWESPIPADELKERFKTEEALINKVQGYIKLCIVCGWEAFDRKGFSNKLRTDLTPYLRLPIAEWVTQTQPVAIKAFDTAAQTLYCDSQVARKHRAWLISYLSTQWCESLGVPLITPKYIPNPFTRTGKSQTTFSSELCSQILSLWGRLQRIESRDELLVVRDGTVIETTYLMRLLEAFDASWGQLTENQGERIKTAAILSGHVEEHDGTTAFEYQISTRNPKLIESIYSVEKIEEDRSFLIKAIQQVKKVNVISLFKTVMDW